MRHRSRVLTALMAVTLGALFMGAAALHAQGHGGPPGMGGMMGRGMGPGMGRDSATMAVMQTVHPLMMEHAKLRRTVTPLPNGIRTVTESDDSTLAAIIRSHVAVTGAFMAESRDLRHPMATPTLRALLQRGAQVVRRTEATAHGVVVEETSDDPEVVRLLHQHAADVSGLVERGPAAMHEAMMQRRGGPPASPPPGHRLPP